MPVSVFPFLPLYSLSPRLCFGSTDPELTEGQLFLRSEIQHRKAQRHKEAISQHDAGSSHKAILQYTPRPLASDPIL